LPRGGGALGAIAWLPKLAAESVRGFLALSLGCGQSHLVCCKAKLLPSRIEDCIIRWCLRSGAPKSTAPTLDRPIRREVLVVVHAIVQASANTIAGHDYIVPIEVILMAFECGACAKGTANISIHIIVVVVVMSSKIILHGLATINEEVVMGVVKAATIVVVNIFLG